MDDPFTFADLLIWLSPLLLPLWLWCLIRVLRDLRRPWALRRETAYCGLPRRPLSPSPLAQFIRRDRRTAFRPHAA
jgi:hypothetical protein